MDQKSVVTSQIYLTYVDKKISGRSRVIISIEDKAVVFIRKQIEDLKNKIKKNKKNLMGS